MFTKKGYEDDREEKVVYRRNSVGALPAIAAAGIGTGAGIGIHRYAKKMKARRAEKLLRASRMRKWGIGLGLAGLGVVGLALKSALGGKGGDGLVNPGIPSAGKLREAKRSFDDLYGRSGLYFKYKKDLDGAILRHNNVAGDLKSLWKNFLKNSGS